MECIVLCIKFKYVYVENTVAHPEYLFKNINFDVVKINIHKKV